MIWNVRRLGPIAISLAGLTGLAGVGGVAGVAGLAQELSHADRQRCRRIWQLSLSIVCFIFKLKLSFGLISN